LEKKPHPKENRNLMAEPRRDIIFSDKVVRPYAKKLNSLERDGPTPKKKKFGVRGLLPRKKGRLHLKQKKVAPKEEEGGGSLRRKGAEKKIPFAPGEWAYRKRKKEDYNRLREGGEL